MPAVAGENPGKWMSAFASQPGFLRVTLYISPKFTNSSYVICLKLKRLKHRLMTRLQRYFRFVDSESAI